jgi:methionyl-tRNA formyltransferase
MRLVFAGTPNNAADTLAAIVAAGHEVVGVITRPPAPSGRGRKPRESAVASLASDLGLDLFDPQSMRRPNVFAWLKERSPEVAVVVAYGGLVPPNLLPVPEFGWVNIHYSLLPRWRGAAPVAHAIAHGDTNTGVTVFELEVGLDAGPVLAAREAEILATDTTGSLLGRLTGIGSDLINEVLANFDAYADNARPQSEEGVSFAPRLQVTDANVPWGSSAVEADRWLRATTPNPGGWASFANARIGIAPFAKVIADESKVDAAMEFEIEPALAHRGQILLTKDAVWVRCREGLVMLGEVKPAGKRSMPATDWVRGLRGVTLAFD